MPGRTGEEGSECPGVYSDVQEELQGQEHTKLGQERRGDAVGSREAMVQ